MFLSFRVPPSPCCVSILPHARDVFLPLFIFSSVHIFVRGSRIYCMFLAFVFKCCSVFRSCVFYFLYPLLFYPLCSCISMCLVCWRVCMLRACRVQHNGTEMHSLPPLAVLPCSTVTACTIVLGLQVCVPKICTRA